MDKPAPPVTALAWVVLDRKTRKVLFGRLEKDRREIASLTKILTVYTVLSLVERLKICLKSSVVVTDEAAEVEGTSASLEVGDTLTIE
jgi:serine-type D-Ala-D-Ala carboxypeptidase (penicillin-binding protein 5/6)